MSGLQPEGHQGHIRPSPTGNFRQRAWGREAAGLGRGGGPPGESPAAWTPLCASPNLFKGQKSRPGSAHPPPTPRAPPPGVQSGQAWGSRPDEARPPGPSAPEEAESPARAHHPPRPSPGLSEHPWVPCCLDNGVKGAPGSVQNEPPSLPGFPGPPVPPRVPTAGAIGPQGQKTLPEAPLVRFCSNRPHSRPHCLRFSVSAFGPS